MKYQYSTVIGILASISSILSFIPFLTHTTIQKTASLLSSTWLFTHIASHSLWLVYSILTKNIFLFVIAIYFIFAGIYLLILKMIQTPYNTTTHKEKSIRENEITTDLEDDTLI
jgi:uncharacterized protein with PQ loop repeat